MAQDDVRVKLNGGGSETVNNIQNIGPSTLIFDGAARSGVAQSIKNTLTVVGPYNAVTNSSQYPELQALGLIASMVTDSAGDHALETGNDIVAVHGSIPTDLVTLTVPFQLGGAVPDNVITIDASHLEGAFDVDVINPDAFFPPPSDMGAHILFNNTVVTINAVNAMANIVINGVDLNNFPYPYFTSGASFFEGQAIVTVGNGLLSQIQGNVTVNNAVLTVANASSTATDILTMTATTLTGWSVPSGVAEPTLTFSPLLYLAFTIQAGNGDSFDIEETPQVMAEVAQGNPDVTIENTATSAPPDSIYLVGSDPSVYLVFTGDYSLYLGRRLNPDGSVTDLGKVAAIQSNVTYDYTGTGGNANLVYYSSNDTFATNQELIGYYLVQSPYTQLAGAFTRNVSLYFRDSRLNFTFDSSAVTGDQLFLDNLGTDNFTYNANKLPVASLVSVYNTKVPISINGNGSTQVAFVQNVANDSAFDLYASIAADVSIDDSSIDVQENSFTSYLPPLPGVVLTGGMLTGATMVNIIFTRPTGFSFEEDEPILMTMTVVNTPAGITTALNVTGTILTILATTGPLDVTGIQGNSPQSQITVGNGTLTSILGNVVLNGMEGGANYGYVVSLLDQNANPASNVTVAANGREEVFAGLIPASISFDGGSAINLFGPAGSSYTISESISTFNLHAGQGSTVSIDDDSINATNFLTVIGAAQVNVARGYLQGITGITIEADPARPAALTDVTINATLDGGEWNFVLGDGLPGFIAFQFAEGNNSLTSINLQAATVALTLQLPISVTTRHGLSVNDTGLLTTTIDEGAEPTTLAGTTGSLLLESNDPASITIGNGGSLRGINGQVSVLTTTPTGVPTGLIVDDSADATSRSATLASVAGGLYAITGLAPAAISYLAIDYALTLDGGSGGNNFTVLDNAAGGPIVLNTGPGNDAVDVLVSGTGGFAPLTVNGGVGTNTLSLGGVSDQPTVTNTPSGVAGSGTLKASYPPSSTIRTVNYTGIGTFATPTTVQFA